MPAKRENCVGEFVRRKYPDLVTDNFQAYNNLVSKLRSRAKARGFNPSDLTQEQFDTINSDTLPELEKGEKVHLDWEHSSMCKSMIEDGIRYLTDNDDYWDKLIVNSTPSEDGDNILNYLYVPSTVKMAARGLKYGNNFLLQASHLSPQYVDLVKDKLQEKAANYSITKEVEVI